MQLTCVVKSAVSSVSKGGAEPRGDWRNAATIKISASSCVLPIRRGALRKLPAAALSKVSLYIVISERPEFRVH